MLTHTAKQWNFKNMTDKDALYFLDEIEDTFRKTKMIYRHGKDETAFDRAIERSENYIELLREYFKNSVGLADVSVNEVEFCTCGNPSGEGNIQMINNEELLYFCCDCNKQVKN